MKKIKISEKSNPSLLLIVMSFILVFIIAAILILLVVSAINNNLLRNYSFFWWLLTGVIVIFLVSIILSLFVSTKINKYVGSIRTALNKVANGDFKVNFKKSKSRYVNEIIDDFNKMTDKLNSVSMLRNDFVSNFSHEFKTPLASIKGFAELLRDKKNLSEEEKNEYLEIIIDECTRMSELANNTLLISKLDTETLLETKAKIFLDEQIDQCLFLFEKSIKQKGIEIKSNLKKSPYICDKKLINQVWINLISNAIKFCDKKIEINLKKDKENNYIISIANDGTRVANEQLEMIFDKFYQADKSRNSEGNGLGLAITKRIINLHNGTIYATCNPDENFTINIMLNNKYI